MVLPCQAGRGGRGGDAPAGAPKGFPLALWKPSDVAFLHGSARRVALDVQESRPALPRLGDGLCA